MIPVDPPYRDPEWLPGTREDCYKLGWTTARQAIRSTQPVETEALRRLIEDFINREIAPHGISWNPPEDVKGVWDWDGEPRDDHPWIQGQVLMRKMIAETLLEKLYAALAPLSGPVDASSMPFDPSNHHNALACPYCNPDSLSLSKQTPQASVEAIHEHRRAGPVDAQPTICTCTPCTAAGVMAFNPHCPVHGTPKVKLSFAPGFDGLTGRPVMAYSVPAGPVDASGESCAYAECVWPKCREYGGYITNPLCSKRTSAPAAAVPSSPAQEKS